MPGRPKQFGRGKSWRRPGGLVPGTSSSDYLPGPGISPASLPPAPCPELSNVIDLDQVRRDRQTERLAGAFRETSLSCPVLDDYITEEECRVRRESLLKECETCSLNPGGAL